ncbi:MAG: hypothetical protein CBD18_03820 [Opitutales bacterium TMED158]|nr:MAG: hypothetical protein CBD18_03820 [Opitutales bacterium TMED158]
MYYGGRVWKLDGIISSEMARVTAGYIPLSDLAHIQELDSWAGDLRSSALLVSGSFRWLANQ